MNHSRLDQVLEVESELLARSSMLKEQSDELAREQLSLERSMDRALLDLLGIEQKLEHLIRATMMLRQP